MPRTHIKDLNSQIGQNVQIAGFAQTIRDQGNLVFLIIRDVTGTVQVVVNKKEVDAETFETAKNLTLESVVSVEGSLKEEEAAPGGFEVKTQKIEVLSKAEPELPIPVMVGKSGDETDVTKRFDWRWIDLRRPEKQFIFKVWTELEKGFHQFFEENGYIQLYTPSLMGTASEGGADVFEVKYFDRKAYLAQSPQFYKQMAMASGLEKVCIFGPVFRAELSYTTRHTTEFTGTDFEISYIESHHDVMDAHEEMLIAGFKRLKEILLPDLEIPTRPFPRIPMKEAKEKLTKAGVSSEKEHDVSPEEEREISRIIKEETGHDFVFLIDWDISVRPFYHMRHEDNSQLTKSFDLLYKGVEVTTGSQREHRPEILEKQAKEMGAELEPLQNYFNFFRYGCPPHGGIGFGPARLIAKILDLPSIKEATFLPRDVKRLTP